MAGSLRCVCGYDAGEATIAPEVLESCPGCGGRFQPVLPEPDAITRLFGSAYGGPDDLYLDPADPGATSPPVSSDKSAPKSRVIVLPVVPGYEILGELGRGGMGVVYKAKQTNLNRIVALKMILAGAHASDVERERFRREAEAVAALQHPGIVQIYEIGEQAGQPYLALEFVEGGSLAQKLASRRDLMPVRECALIAEQLARSMHHAHLLGVVHRDLKPANVLLTLSGDKDVSGRTTPRSGTTAPIPKVTDFGLAKRLDETFGSGATKTGAVMGTPSYIAPEQASGRSALITPAADVYSLGAILYEMLTGRPPFKGDTALDTVLQVLHDEPVSPSRLRPKLPRDLETICLKCLEKDPLNRYATAEDLADDLGRFQRHETILARPQSSAMRGVKWARRHPAITVFALMAILAVATVVGVLATAYAEVREAVEQKENEATLARAARDREKAERIRADANAAEIGDLANALGTALAQSEATAEQLKANVDFNTRSLFALQLSKAAAICERDPKQALELLDDPELCPDDLRDFAWRYLRRLCRRQEWAYASHSSAIVAVAASPDGELVASCDSGGLVRLWNPRTRLTYAMLEGHVGRVNAVSFSAAGDTVATAGDDGTVRIWDLPQSFLEIVRGVNRILPNVPTDWIPTIPGAIVYSTVKPSLTVKAFGHRALCLAFSSNGRTLAAGGSDTAGGNADGVVRTWDLGGRAVSLPLAAIASAATATCCFRDAQPKGSDVLKPGRVIRDHLRPVVALAFSPDGQFLASGSEDASAQVSPMVGPGRPMLLKLHSGTVYSLAFSPDGKTLATVNNAADPYVWLWDVTGRAPKERARLSGHTRAIYSVAFSPDGKTIASAGFDQTVRLWDSESGEERARLQGHTDAIRGLAFVPGQHTLVSVANDRAARIWRLGVNRCETGLLPSEAPMTVNAASVSADGRTLATADKTGVVGIWKLDPGEALTGSTAPRLTSGKLPIAVRGNAAGTGGEMRAIAVSETGRHIVAAGDDGLLVWDTVGLAAKGAALEPRTLLKGRACYALALATDGATLAAATADGVFLWDLHTGKKLREEAILPGAGVREIAFAPPETRTDPPTRIAVAIDRSITVLDLKSGERTTLPQAHTAGIYSLAFAKGGRVLASGGDAGRVKVWQVKSNEKGLELAKRTEMTGHTDTVNVLAFSRDGHSLVSGGQDRTVIVWDPATGQERAMLTGHTDRIVELALAPRDGSLVSIGRDGTVKRWRAEATE